ncbi:MAG TPA: 3-phosphoshikimate 1-carboxyvinyltransferase [Firmicutes bacterium]|nr:3-phosphoshikimate 1-carboxyvinyltransferase [Bacillota bacterium]
MSLIGSLTVGRDKSITHRAIILSSLSKGTTRIRHPLLGADCLSTLTIFKQLGVKANVGADEIVIESPGVSGFNDGPQCFDAGNSGTTARLLMGVFSALAASYEVIGDESLSKRPMKRVTVPLSLMGANITLTDDKYLPARIKGQPLIGMSYTLPVASAQVKSAILFASLFAEGKTTVHEPVQTRDHTEKMFEAFKIDYNKVNETIEIQGPQSPKTPGEVWVPCDISSAAFFIVAALIVKGSRILIKEVGLNETRCGIIEVVQRMGGQITIENERYFGGEKVGDLIVTYSQDLKGITIENELIPRLIDEIPIIALLAAFAKGQTIVKDAEELKVKETNRIDVTVSELQKIGIQIEATADGMIIQGNQEQEIKTAHVSSHGDHRIAMMLSIASLCAAHPLAIEGLEAMNISYPQFLNDLNSLKQN